MQHVFEESIRTWLNRKGASKIYLFNEVQKSKVPFSRTPYYFFFSFIVSFSYMAERMSGARDCNPRL